MKTKEIIITISGAHGTGKSLYTEEIARRFHLKSVTAGRIFRERAEGMGLSLEELNRLAGEDVEIDKKIDDWMVEEARKGGVVADGRLTGWLLKDTAHIRICLTAPLEERLRRIAERDGVPLEVAKRETMAREVYERDRFLRYYQVDIEDLSPYNIILDTSLTDIKTMKGVITSLIEGYLKTH
jgi:cytidylate kinase